MESLALGTSPLVSIIMPFYAQHEFLAEAIGSVIEQTYRPIEVIVVDDCSPGQPVEEFLRDVTSFPVKIRASSGELILPLDCDDRIDRNYLDKAVDLLTSSGGDAVYTDIQIFGDLDLAHTPPMDMIDFMCCKGGPSCFLYTRKLYDAIGGYTETFRRAEDLKFWLAVTVLGAKVMHLAEPLYFYRKHSRGASNFNRTSPMRDMLQDHRELYHEKLEEVLLRMEEKYWKEVDQYAHLHKEFHILLGRYEHLTQALEQQAAAPKPTVLARCKRLLSRVFQQVVHTSAP
jgi:glycosyltransferase involved in cell wall biosynthesis